MITLKDSDTDDVLMPSLVFDQKTANFLPWSPLSIEKQLERLSFQVSRSPKSLRAHVQRIHFCFDHSLNDQLYAALIDLFIVLGRFGQSLRKRMVYGAKLKLTEIQFQNLNRVLTGKIEPNKLIHNHYTLLTSGFTSSKPMVEIYDNVIHTGHDPLELARDFIEFSQFDEAKKILEEAVLNQTDQIEYQLELLSIYRSTRDKSGFERMKQNLVSLGTKLPKEWELLNDFLKGVS